MKPRLIELKGYVKNFKDGTITEHVKMKPMTGYRGRTTVQLFNAETGELEQEVLSENVINNWIAKDSFDSNFRGQVDRYKMGLFAGPFSYLLLSDAAVPESASAKEIVGDMIAYSARDTYSGSAINRGTLNTAESWYSNRATAGKTTAHLVFDFPTHAANGTIRTIYWAPSQLQVEDIAQGALNTGGVKRCTHWFYQNYPNLSRTSTLPFEIQQVRSYSFMYAVPSMQGRVNMTTKMFYGVTEYDNALQFGIVDIDRFNMAESDMVKCTYADGSVYTSYPSIKAVHIDPAAQLFKILFYTAKSTSYKDMPLRYTFYEVTFNFSGTTQSVQSFNRDLLLDATRYPTSYATGSNNWYYKNNGMLTLVDNYATPSTNPIEYENYEIQLNAAFTAVTKVNIRQVIANFLNAYYRTTSYTVTSPEVLQGRVRYCNFVKDDVIAYSISTPLTTLDYNIFRRSDNACLYTGYDWYSFSGNNYSYAYYYGSNTLIGYYNISGSIGCWFGQFTMLPSAQNLLPSNVTKTDVNTMKIQYDFIIDENDFVTDYVPNGGK